MFSTWSLSRGKLFLALLTIRLNGAQIIQSKQLKTEEIHNEERNENQTFEISKNLYFSSLEIFSVKHKKYVKN